MLEPVKGVSLRDNYVKMMTAVAEQVESGVSVLRLVGYLDDPKLRSSLRLFERVSRGFDEEVNATCRRAMEAMDEEPEPEASTEDLDSRRSPTDDCTRCEWCGT